jgi:GT2 family glycosyltransferase
MPPGGLAVVTVTRNSARVLPGLLRTAAAHLPEARIVAVDCGSEDTSVALARSAGATVIALDDNVGFGRGCNRGVLEVDEAVTALLNPDVELVDDSLGLACEEVMRQDRLLAPLVLSLDGSRQDTVHPRPASPADIARSILPQIGSALAPWRSRLPRRVGWAVGCAIVGRTSTLRALGPFDQQIFMYNEDLDLCLRAHERGIETWFWPAARVVHHGGHAALQEFGGEAFELIARSRHEVVRRRLGPRLALVDDLAQALTFTTRIAARRLLGRDAGRERRQLDALRLARRSS